MAAAKQVVESGGSGLHTPVSLTAGVQWNPVFNSDQLSTVYGGYMSMHPLFFDP